ncbi:MAG: hypothetical protein D3922_04285 [Candidatus Electrothrix sp. AR1]|nr:hypothetical protein [Candidatus Electrothrix sp. AR1]
MYAALSILGVSSLHAEEKKHLSYPELGITTSSMLIHPSIGYWWDRIGLRVSGMYLNEDQHEFHLNIGYEFSASENLQQSINLLTSRVAGSDPGADYKYWATGIAYGVNYKGFFLELGLARLWEDELGNLANDSVIPCGYVGYMYRFRTE